LHRAGDARRHSYSRSRRGRTGTDFGCVLIGVARTMPAEPGRRDGDARDIASRGFWGEGAPSRASARATAGRRPRPLRDRSSSGIYRTNRERRANIPLTTVRIGSRHDVGKRGFSLPGAAPKGRGLKSIGVVPKTSLRALRALAGSGTPRMTVAWAS